MKNKEQIKGIIKQDLKEADFLKLALEIFEYVCKDVQNIQFSLYTKEIKEIRKESSGADLFRAIQYLFGARAKVLEIKFLFVDSPKQYKLKNSKVVKARKTGVFLHPETKKPVENFGADIFMYFEATEYLKKQLNN